MASIHPPRGIDEIKTECAIPILLCELFTGITLFRFPNVCCRRSLARARDRALIANTGSHYDMGSHRAARQGARFARLCRACTLQVKEATLVSGLRC